jgi:hypothetical protein
MRLCVCVRAYARVKIWFISCLVGLTVVPVYFSLTNAGDGNAPFTHPIALRVLSSLLWFNST